MKLYQKLQLRRISRVGFEVAGISPYNPDTFKDLDYAPSSVTDRPEPKSENEAGRFPSTENTDGDNVGDSPDRENNVEKNERCIAHNG